MPRPCPLLRGKTFLPGRKSLAPWRGLNRNKLRGKPQWQSPAFGWAGAATLAGAVIGVGLYVLRPAEPTVKVAHAAEKTSPVATKTATTKKKVVSNAPTPRPIPTAYPLSPAAPTPLVVHPAPEEKRAFLPRSISNAKPLLKPAPVGVLAETPDDLKRINVNPAIAAAEFREWARTSADEWTELEARIRQTATQKDDFVTIPLPRLASLSDRALIAAATMDYQKQAAIVDARLQRTVTLAAMGEPFRDLCARLSRDTGIEIAADASVAEDKVTLLCEKRSLRDVMRQISRHFGFTWRREGEKGEYRYTLSQELPSLLLEEEMRNRDRDAALMAIEQEMYPYRFLLKYSAAQAREEGIKEYLRVTDLQRSGKSKPSDELRLNLLDKYYRHWGAINQYFDLTAEQRAALLRGDRLIFSTLPNEGEYPLSSERERNVRESQRESVYLTFLDGENNGSNAHFVTIRDLGEAERLRRIGINREPVPGGVALMPRSVADVPQARGIVSLFIEQREPGKAELHGGHSWLYVKNGKRTNGTSISSTIVDGHGLTNPFNFKQNRYRMNPARTLLEQIKVASFAVTPTAKTYPSPVSDSPTFYWGTNPAARQADILRQFHQLTGWDVIGDEFTRLFEIYDLPKITKNSAFGALCQISDAIGVRWNVAAGEEKTPWLAFRRLAYFNDRITDVPTEKLARWSALRKERGYLSGEEIAEISRLSDLTLNSSALEKGAVGIYGLRGWAIANSVNLRPWWRFYNRLSEESRRSVWAPDGLKIASLTPEEQQQFLNAMGYGSTTMQPWQRNAMLNQGVIQGGYVKPKQWGVSVQEAEPDPSRPDLLPPQRGIEFLYNWTSASGGARFQHILP